MSPSRPAAPRDIEAAIADYNSTDRVALPREAVRLLTVMFPQSTVCQRPLKDLVAEGFDRWPLEKLLRGLVDAGFLSKGPRHQGRYGFTTYTLHLPSRRQP